MKGTDVNKSKEGNGEILSKEESWRQVKVCVRNGNRNLYVCDADGLYCNHSNECGYEEILWALTVDNTGAAQSYLSAADQAAQKVERQREKSKGTCNF